MRLTRRMKISQRMRRIPLGAPHGESTKDMLARKLKEKGSK
jgi:hypothetical protein